MTIIADDVPSISSLLDASEKWLRVFTTYSDLSYLWRVKAVMGH